MRPTWVEISLDVLQQNYVEIRKIVGVGIPICAVVKADAYGHGAVQCSRALEAAGARWFGVTSTEEGMELRRGGINARILLMTGFWQGEEQEVVSNRLTPAIWEFSHIDLLKRAVQKLNGTQICVHLKLDTGMARLGAAPRDLADLLGVLSACRELKLEGVFTHFSSAELLEAPDTAEQMGVLASAKVLIRNSGLEPTMFHLANSAACLARPETWADMVRPGLLLYGHHLPSINLMNRSCKTPRRISVGSVLSWKTRIISLRDVADNQPIGYGRAYRTSGPTKLAILPVGYGDGLSRGLSSRGRAIVLRTYAPIVGNIAMDITTLDVTGVPGVKVGDVVTILGADGECRVSPSDHAAIVDTIPYEILCRIGKRVPRRYSSGASLAPKI